MTSPSIRTWNEIGVYPKLCMGTMRRALSKVHSTLMKEMDDLKKEGNSVNSGSIHLC